MRINVYLSKRVFLLLLLGLALLLVACGGAAQPAAPAGEKQDAAPAQEDAAAPAESSGEKITIKLAENPWTGSAVNVAVAKILLEKELGYPVEIVTIDENAQWAALASGDLSASLEVWPSGHAENVKQYIDEQKVVENGGELGVIGKIGWYEPAYVVEQHAELATWEGFKNPELATLFKTAETGDKGQFLAGDPSWVQYDDQIIKNLGLNLQPVVAGSEQAVLAQLDSAYSRQEPILFYFWTPHSVHAKYKLTEVKLPEYSEACYEKAEAGGVDCDYPADVLFKIFWGDLKNQAPDAYTLLKNFKYTTEDQIGMIAAVELDKKSAADAAQAWVDGHQDAWKAWLQ
ncbi:MAG: ABC transporter substrate-binding protein [Chloroflexi bacterium]|nr:ABC transporter substrate-binding protein [Chloroflexota bacterium]